LLLEGTPKNIYNNTVMKKLIDYINKLQFKLQIELYETGASNKALTLANKITEQIESIQRQERIKSAKPINDNVKKVRDQMLKDAKEDKYGKEVLDEIKGCSDFDDLNSAAYTMATEVGENKGWGDEAIGELAYDILHAAAEKAGAEVDDNF